MDRVLEPELMVGAEQVRAYSQADFEEENQGFVDRFAGTFPGPDNAEIVDLGCGPGDIPIRLARKLPTAKIIGIDASDPMITIAKQAVKEAGLTERITLLCQRFQEVKLSDLVDGVISNSLVHHVPNPLQFWFAIKTLAKPGAPVLVMDLIRPETEERSQGFGGKVRRR